MLYDGYVMGRRVQDLSCFAASIGMCRKIKGVCHVKKRG